jgi:hypothetical protein
MEPNIRANEIGAAFQRYLTSNDTSEIDAFSLQELRSADEQLGEKDINAGFRIAIRNKICDLKLKETKKQECKLRAMNLLVGILIGFVIAGFVGGLFTT